MTLSPKEDGARITCKKVLILSALDYWSMGKSKGGPALFNTLIGYAERDWQVYFITGNRAQETSDDLHRNIQVIRFDAPWLKQIMQIRKIGFFAKILWWLYFQSIAFLKAQKLASRTKFDVVYGYEIYGVPVAKLLSKLWKVPMLARFQGTSFGVGWQKRRFRFLRAWNHVVGLKIPAHLVLMTNDGTQGDKVLQQLGIDMSKVRFWMNGIDWHLFDDMRQFQGAKSLLGLNDKFVLLCTSRLVSWKRVDRSIQALPDVVNEYSTALLVIVGDGPERKRLEHMARELGVREHVRFEGAVPHSAVLKYFAAADIFLSFYEWSNVGNPLLEAMIAGKCIVTLNNGDTGRFVKNGQTGALLEYEELSKLSDVIKELLANENIRDQLGANARKFAEKNFWSWEERMEAEIKEVTLLVEQ